MIKSKLTDKEKQDLIILSNKIPHDKEAVIKLADRYFKIKELG